MVANGGRTERSGTKESGRVEKSRSSLGRPGSDPVRERVSPQSFGSSRSLALRQMATAAEPHRHGGIGETVSDLIDTFLNVASAGSRRSSTRPASSRERGAQTLP